jgi:hypothetical protein
MVDGMKVKRPRNRLEWLSALSTRELVIYLMELQRVQEQQPGLADEVGEACDVLRQELLRRETPASASR